MFIVDNLANFGLVLSNFQSEQTGNLLYSVVVVHHWTICPLCNFFSFQYFKIHYGKCRGPYNQGISWRRSEFWKVAEWGRANWVREKYSKYICIYDLYYNTWKCNNNKIIKFFNKSYVRQVLSPSDLIKNINFN